jgi:GxxExxY protein
MSDLHENNISGQIVDAAIAVHTKLGPGLLESVYEVVLTHELRKRGLHCERQKPVPIIYDDIHFEEGFRIDILVEGKVIVELKSVEQVHPVHSKQVLTYLRLTNMRLGLLLNFGEVYLKDGITRLVHRLPE